MIRIAGKGRDVCCDAFMCRRHVMAPGETADEARARIRGQGWLAAITPQADRTVDLCPDHADKLTEPA